MHRRSQWLLLAALIVVVAIGSSPTQAAHRVKRSVRLKIEKRHFYEGEDLSVTAVYHASEAFHKPTAFNPWRPGSPPTDLVRTLVRLDSPSVRLNQNYQSGYSRIYKSRWTTRDDLNHIFHVAHHPGDDDSSRFARQWRDWKPGHLSADHVKIATDNVEIAGDTIWLPPPGHYGLPPGKYRLTYVWCQTDSATLTFEIHPVPPESRLTLARRAVAGLWGLMGQDGTEANRRVYLDSIGLAAQYAIQMPRGALLRKQLLEAITFASMRLRLGWQPSDSLLIRQCLYELAREPGDGARRAAGHARDYCIRQSSKASADALLQLADEFHLRKFTKAARYRARQLLKPAVRAR